MFWKSIDKRIPHYGGWEVLRINCIKWNNVNNGTLQWWQSFPIDFRPHRNAFKVFMKLTPWVWCLLNWKVTTLDLSFNDILVSENSSSVMYYLTWFGKTNQISLRSIRRAIIWVHLHFYRRQHKVTNNT